MEKFNEMGYFVKPDISQNCLSKKINNEFEVLLFKEGDKLINPQIWTNNRKLWSDIISDPNFHNMKIDTEGCFSLEAVEQIKIISKILTDQQETEFRNELMMRDAYITAKKKVEKISVD